jgi:hypothetical protein
MELIWISNEAICSTRQSGRYHVHDLLSALLKRLSMWFPARQPEISIQTFEAEVNKTRGKASAPPGNCKSSCLDSKYVFTSVHGPLTLISLSHHALGSLAAALSCVIGHRPSGVTFE